MLLQQPAQQLTTHFKMLLTAQVDKLYAVIRQRVPQLTQTEKLQPQNTSCCGGSARLASLGNTQLIVMRQQKAFDTGLTKNQDEKQLCNRHSKDRAEGMPV